MKTLMERFYDKVEKREDGCREWAGARFVKGYGEFCFNGKHVRAHRASYELHVGPIPAGMFVCHRCDNPPCVRPDHLWLGTNSDNVADMDAKGRRPKERPGVARGERSGSARLTEKQVLEIRAAYVPYKVTIVDLARKYGVTDSQVHRIVTRQRWKHVK